MDGAGTWLYIWDYENRLTQVTKPDGQTVTYKYDALGRRIERSKGGQWTRFTYDGADVVLDRSSDGSAVEYTNGLGIDEKLAQRSNGGGVLYFVADHLSSTRALTDSAGNVVEQVNYDAFGDSAGSSLTRYGYTGRERDADTGLYYYRARWYDSAQGRFISEDPIEFEGGVNWYAYVSNDPVNLIDPFGLQDGPRNPLRNPCPPENWVCNAVANTVSDALGLDEVAELSYGIGDHRRPAEDRIRDAAELGGRTAMTAGVGGVVIGRACKIAGKGLKFIRNGREIVLRNGNLRIAPFGNRTGHPIGKYPHYHRRGPKAPNGQTRPGQGIGRHRPLERSPHDKSIKDRF